MSIRTLTQVQKVNTFKHLCLQSATAACQSSSRGAALWDWWVCVHRSLAGVSPLSVPFAQEPDELWQAGLCGSIAHGSPDQSTAMFDRDAEKVPGGTREPSVTKSQRPWIKPLHSVNFLNGAHGHSRGVLAEQFLQRPESGNSTQRDSQLSATHGHTRSFTWCYGTRC